MMEAVYLLCAATSIVCALLLLRGYRSSKARLLLWSCLCFVGLAVENVLLFVDLVVFPDLELGVSPNMSLDSIRRCIALAGLMLLIYGLIHEQK